MSKTHEISPAPQNGITVTVSVEPEYVGLIDEVPADLILASAGRLARAAWDRHQGGRLCHEDAAAMQLLVLCAKRALEVPLPPASQYSDIGGPRPGRTSAESVAGWGYFFPHLYRRGGGLHYVGNREAYAFANGATHSHGDALRSAIALARYYEVDYRDDGIIPGLIRSVRDYLALTDGHGADTREAVHSPDRPTRP